MNIEEIREYCLKKRGAEEDFPFDETTLVIKVMGKVFAILPLDDVLQISLKCNPEKALELREAYPCVTPGYHLNKKHWNTIMIDGSIPQKTIYSWIDHSYDLVIQKLSKKVKNLL